MYLHLEAVSEREKPEVRVYKQQKDPDKLASY